MHTPTKTQWQLVIDNLKKALPLATLENHLNMSEPVVSSWEHPCGTIHCLGGWYLIGSVGIENISEKNYVSYDEGTELMASHLGIADVADWANDNPEIWGNEHGYQVFSDIEAFNDARTLGDIITYLEGVRDRSPN